MNCWLEVIYTSSLAGERISWTKQREGDFRRFVIELLYCGHWCGLHGFPARHAATAICH